jgi:hypothetical protein
MTGVNDERDNNCSQRNDRRRSDIDVARDDAERRADRKDGKDRALID